MLWNPLYNQHFTFNAKHHKIIRKMNRNATYPSKYYPAHPWRLVPRIKISSRDTHLSYDYYLTVEFHSKVEFLNLRIAVNESGIMSPDKTKRRKQKRLFGATRSTRSYSMSKSRSHYVTDGVPWNGLRGQFNTKFYGYYFYFAIFRCFDE